MEIRQMATAFLFNQDKVLMMKKVSSKFYNAESWSGLGGHLEPNELNYPKKACFREIFEESGFYENEIEDLKLRYILLRIKENEIRQQYVYFGNTGRTEYINSEEGELHWINKDKMLKLHMSGIIKFMIVHYFKYPNLNEITIGTITINNEEEPKIQWAELKDPKIF